MKKFFLALLLLSSASFVLSQKSFMMRQLQNKRVCEAMKSKSPTVKKLLDSAGLKAEKLNILIIILKKERVLNVYAKSSESDDYGLLGTFDICALSGGLGPKRREGDLQVPEGFYHINRFNPQSHYFLSLGLNYPNKADLLRDTVKNHGSNIFIHGSCVSAGCIAITDDKIKELYILAVYARNSGQRRIPVYIFPFEMTKENFKTLGKPYSDDTELIAFWKNLQEGYEKFSQSHKELIIGVNDKGKYIFR